MEHATAILAAEPPLIRLESRNTLLVGDTHGDLQSTVNAFRRAEELGASLIFLGDYVDRGPQQLENLAAVLDGKLESPSKIYLLRGNHETVSMNEYYGFYEVVAAAYGQDAYPTFARLFSQLPYALLLNNEILCLHGGLPEGVEKVEDLASLPKGLEEPRDPVVTQLLWNDPDEDISGFQPSPRGGGAKLFGPDALYRFMSGNGLKLLVRAHQPISSGYCYLFGGRLLTVFSCRYYGLRPKAALVADGRVDIEDIG